MQDKNREGLKMALGRHKEAKVKHSKEDVRMALSMMKAKSY